MGEPYRAASAPAAYASTMVLPPSLQSSLPAGWLAFTGRELNPLDRYKRFQITFPSSFSGFVLAQGKFHGIAPPVRSAPSRHPTRQQQIDGAAGSWRFSPPAGAR